MDKNAHQEGDGALLAFLTLLATVVNRSHLSSSFFYTDLVSFQSVPTARGSNAGRYRPPGR